MDDFEYSLEISDRDWECFFVECEECNLLPPSIARVDDSGMSDFDDTLLTQRARRVCPTLGSPVNNPLVDGPLKRSDSPPAAQCFETKESGGFDSVLSGSEEDIHLQSVNIFFERLKGPNETEPDKERAGNNREAKQGEHQVSASTLPKSSTKCSTLPDGVEKAFGKESQSPVDPIWNINTMKTDTAGSNFFSEPETCSTSPLSFCKSPETDLYITEGDFTDSVVDEFAGSNPLHDSTESVVGSDSRAQPCRLEMWRSMDDVKQDTPTSPESFCTKWSYREDKMSSPEGTQLVSLRRKRRRKRRLSLEAGEGGHPCGRHSKEDHLMAKEGKRLFLSTETLDLKEHKNLTYVLTPNPATIRFPENFSAQEIKIELSLSVSPSDNQCQPLHQEACTGSNYLTNHTPKPPLSQSDDTTNNAANSKPNGEFQVTESPGLIGNHPDSPVSASKVETEKSKGQKQEAKSADLPPSDERNVSASDCKNEQHAKHPPAEVKSVTRLPCAESCAPAMEVVQKGKLSTAKSDLAAEAGNSGLEKRTVCQSDFELESDGQITNQSGTTLEETPFSVHTTGGITSEPGAFQDETLDEVIRTYLTSEHINKSANKSYLSGSVSGLDIEQQTDSIELLTTNIVSEKHENVQISPISNSRSDIQIETEASQNENLQTTPPHLSCRPTLDSGVGLSLSSENKFPVFCSAVNEHESVQEEKEQQNLLADQETNRTFACKENEVVTASKDVDKPGRMLNSVFAMSSFWREMEKLTINDILGLRNADEPVLHGLLPAVTESEETAVDSGIFIEEDEPNPEEATEEVHEVVSSSSRSVTWQSDPVLVSQNPESGPESMMLECETDSQPVLTERPQKCLKKISKTVSVHNLPALESDLYSYTCKGDGLRVLEEQETENLTFADNGTSKKDTTFPSSSTNTYRISFTDIFQYFFGGKQSISSQPAREDTTTLYTSGNSIPETYDHFFSEFDSESFFYPLLTAEEKNKGKPVPIFSYSRSTCRNFQFPEAYEHFFASSSSDDSSGESDEEENYRPVKVVTRFSRKLDSRQITTDVYENFFTDSDIAENLFSLSSLSFRKVSFTAPAAQEERTDLLEPVRQNSSHQFQKIGFPVNTLGSPDVTFPDPLLYHLEERISRQLALQPCRYEGLEVAVSDPKLDAPFLPLKQSDMCLVCIAFASWVLKTANPGTGDAWKAALLANMSALSAIRYLRKYVKVEPATSETRTRCPALES
ncbi:PGC-1 and ERR-induced regulator in muscle protein 1 [Poeciliopsis prolifica]|uniref:PGC-1 and ERR-induced regulator in muscle protein 1 n=1 Tax=Poeciliopsis prolifica TaxID=188132 RepID=UPI002413908D|nr:PGC-1 and ERR-induced regulator in muscle protein 1 [Poeciliopsis prolifica]